MSEINVVDILEWLNRKCQETRLDDPEAFAHYEYVRDDLFKSVFRMEKY